MGPKVARRGRKRKVIAFGMTAGKRVRCNMKTDEGDCRYPICNMLTILGQGVAVTDCREIAECPDLSVVNLSSNSRHILQFNTFRIQIQFLEKFYFNLPLLPYIHIAEEYR